MRHRFRSRPLDGRSRDHRVRAGRALSRRRRRSPPPIQLPHGDRDRAEGAGRSADAAGQRHGRAARPRCSDAGVGIVSEAGQYSPEHLLHRVQRPASSATRGSAASAPARPIPGVTTYFDGVPQLNANTSSIDLLDVEQVEFVRGPQSALFGRNALGGLVNVMSSRRPSLSAWTGSFSAPFANAGSHEIARQRRRARGVGGRGRRRVRDGLRPARRLHHATPSPATTLDDRARRSRPRGSCCGRPPPNWETRAHRERRARPRRRLCAARSWRRCATRPFIAARDFEGFTHRDLFGTTILNRHEGGAFRVHDHHRLR